MESDERPIPRGNPASQLASESLDPLSQAELVDRIALLEREIARVRAHIDKARAHRAAAEALFGKPPSPPGAGRGESSPAEGTNA